VEALSLQRGIKKPPRSFLNLALEKGKKIAHSSYLWPISGKNKAVGEGKGI